MLSSGHGKTWLSVDQAVMFVDNPWTNMDNPWLPEEYPWVSVDFPWISGLWILYGYEWISIDNPQTSMDDLEAGDGWVGGHFLVIQEETSRLNSSIYSQWHFVSVFTIGNRTRKLSV